MIGQKRLKAARVLIVGTGGLGSPVAMYLAATGIGTLGIVDFDCVDISNLQRQIIHDTANIGIPKVESAKTRIKSMNPNTEVITYNLALSQDNAIDIFDGYDVVVGCTDNYQSRFLINDTCILLGIPNVYGAIYSFEGQASVFGIKGGPCYRCLYPTPPPQETMPKSSEVGVIGILPGIIGVIQASEVIKLIVGCGENLTGRLLLFDALGMSFDEIKLEKNEMCPICGKNL